MTKIQNQFESANDSSQKSTSAYESGLEKVFSYDGSNVTFRAENGIVYVNATEMAKPFNKQPYEYLRLTSTNELISSITGFSRISENQLVIRKPGSPENGGGTWLHEDIALDFAQWLSVDFKIWCNAHIKELLLTGKTEIRKEPVPTMTKEEYDLKVRDLSLREAEILERVLARTNVPEYASIINHYIVEKVTGNSDAIPLPESKERLYSATEVGDMLGVSSNKIGRLAKEHNLKTEEYGKWFFDKSKYSNKEVESFKYNERAIGIFRELLSLC